MVRRVVSGAPKNLAARFDVSRETICDLQIYVATLLKWQEKINLIGPATVDEIWQRHIADSLSLVPIVQDLHRGGPLSFVDLGTGAGLPGVPLSLSLRATGNVHAHLVDSNLKKAAFLREVIRLTNLNASIYAERAERLSGDRMVPEPQFVLARAFAPLRELSNFALPWLKNGAIGLFQKGRDVEKELERTAHLEGMRYKVQNLDTNSGSVVVVTEFAPEDGTDGNI